MRKLAKAAKPPILEQNEAGWTAELLTAAPGTHACRRIEARYGNAEIRERLGEETYRKCAYCESLIDAVSFPHVEHIRPKSLHRDLVFAWSNLTLACQICNTRKGARDPDGTNFVHPYEDEPETRFNFFGPVIAPSVNDLAARNMINWIDLNRAQLVVNRAEVVNRVLSIYLEAIALPVGARRQFLTLSLAPLTSREGQYSRVAQSMVSACEMTYGAVLEHP